MNTNNAYTLKSKNGVKPIFNITPFSLLDYSDKAACILWFAGCNMRCVYCYNPEIVLGKGKLDFSDALRFLQTRINLLDAVVLSGGECTLHKGVIDFIIEIKKLGFLVKVDTNGTNPAFIKEVSDNNLVDFISLDFKAPIKKFSQITGSRLYQKFNLSLEILVQSTIKFEVRTTIHSDLLNDFDFQLMLNHLHSKNYKGIYYLQNYLDAPETIAPLSASKKSYLNTRNNLFPIQVEIRN